MLDVIDLGCPILRTPSFEHAMTIFGYFGNGIFVGAVGLALFAQGYVTDNERNKQAGMAVIAALIISGGIAELVKYTVHMPRPKLRPSNGFPSLHATAASSLATTLTATVPSFGPVFFSLGLLAGISRLYFRASYTFDVVVGMLIGVVASVPVALKIIQDRNSFDRNFLVIFAWLPVVALAVVAFAFFQYADKSIAAYIVRRSAATNSPAAVFDFGTPQARPGLRYGWSGDERWAEKRSVVWGSGLASEFVANVSAAQDYRFRLTAYPNAPKGPVCQRVEVRVNNATVVKLLLDRGWHDYEFNVSKGVLQTGANAIQFFYDYAETPKLRARKPDERALSVAFDKLEIFSQK